MRSSSQLSFHHIENQKTTNVVGKRYFLLVILRAMPGGTSRNLNCIFLRLIEHHSLPLSLCSTKASSHTISTSQGIVGRLPLITTEPMPSSWDVHTV